jgi:hypothetical protein
MDAYNCEMLYKFLNGSFHFLTILVMYVQVYRKSMSHFLNGSFHFLTISGHIRTGTVRVCLNIGRSVNQFYNSSNTKLRQNLRKNRLA